MFLPSNLQGTACQEALIYHHFWLFGVFYGSIVNHITSIDLELCSTTWALLLCFSCMVQTDTPSRVYRYLGAAPESQRFASHRFSKTHHWVGGAPLSPSKVIWFEAS